MFDIGFWEVTFIGLLALLILGPSRLPEAARTAGQWVGKLRAFITNVKQDLDSQLKSDELAELRRLKDELLQARQTLQETSESMVSSISEGIDQQMQEIVPGSDFIDDAVSASLPAKEKKSGPVQKARRKNGKPAVAQRKNTAGKKKTTKTRPAKKVSKKKNATKGKKKKTKSKVKKKRNGR